MLEYIATMQTYMAPPILGIILTRDRTNKYFVQPKSVREERLTNLKSVTAVRLTKLTKCDNGAPHQTRERESGALIKPSCVHNSTRQPCLQDESR